jgi:hypothetical protein
VIFPNDNLEALGRYQPVTTGEDLHLPRIGAAKVRRYAEPFLEGSGFFSVKTLKFIGAG